MLMLELFFPFIVIILVDLIFGFLISSSFSEVRFTDATASFAL